MTHICDGNETCWASEDWCAGHQRHEPVPEGVTPYRRCGECWHIFVTEQELIDADNEMMNSIVGIEDGDGIVPLPKVKADQIWVCPVCCHDF